MKNVLFILIALLLAPPVAVPAADSAKPQTKLNILFLITDQQTVGALSCAGNPYVKTPNLDRLAARGTRFAKSYCTYPLCCPSRGSLFTSRMPHELGIYGNFDAELSAKGVPTMGELFQAAGYETAYAGKWHIQVPFPGVVDAAGNHKIPGFEALAIAGRNPHKVDLEKDGKGLTVDPNSADAASRFLRRPHPKPFLLVASILNPHDICEFPKCAALRSLLPKDPAQLPPARPNLRDKEKLPTALNRLINQKGDWTEQQWREYLWVYYRLTEIADGEVGRVLATLDQSGLASNTLVVFTSDHGEMMGSHRMVTKQKLYEESAAVPLVIMPPGGQPGVDKLHLVSGLDIMPTLFDYAGIAIPSSLEGRSLRPLVEGRPTPWREFVVTENVSGVDSRMVRTARYKYILFATGENREQFFDLEQDPGELKNLMADTSLAGEVSRHRGLLEQWMKATQDKFGLASTAPKAARAAKGKPANAAGQPTQDRASLFEKKDKNHRGKLTLEEFLANHPNPEKAKSNFARWDTNKDGFMDRDEFINMGKPK
ncbi:MAG: sulfatase-like hydrolase/transferase [Verrucomicrobia bacterium]|nr:sulfatase-like hydrolase/transferase [Verrucomicrobiota bacterium]